MPHALLNEILRTRPGKKEFKRLFSGMAAVVAIGYFLLFAVSLLPQENLRKTLLQAEARGFLSENHPQYDWLRPLYNRLDMYTECLAFGVALNLKPDAAMLLKTPTFGDCPSLRAVVASANHDAPGMPYMRYLHGTQTVLKSLYTFLSLEAVRAVTAGTSLLLLLALFFALKLEAGARRAAIVVASFFLTASPNMFFTVTHATQFWLVLTAAIAAVLGHRRICPVLFFACIGSADAFFSFFSMGSLSLALPLLCFTLARWTAGESSDRFGAEAFWGCVGWSLGFVLPWLLKWLVLHFAFAATRGELFGVTLEQYPARGVTMIALAMQRNFLSANWPYIVLAFVVAALHRRRTAAKTPPGLWTACLPGLLPLLWICVLPGQSGVKHSTYVNIILWPFLSACLLLLLAAPRDADEEVHSASILKSSE
jgi:hypothetical protein